MSEKAEPTFNKREYLTAAAYRSDKHDVINPFVLQEAISSTMLAHPEWDLEERKTYQQWEDEAHDG